MQWYLEVLKKYATFQGRARRKEYWMFTLINAIIMIILSIVDEVAGTAFLLSLYSLAVLLPTLAVGARRLHDINKSGWWQLLNIIPIIGGIILIVWFASNSKEDNRFGPNPKQNEMKEAAAY